MYSSLNNIKNIWVNFEYICLKLIWFRVIFLKFRIIWVEFKQTSARMLIAHLTTLTLSIKYEWQSTKCLGVILSFIYLICHLSRLKLTTMAIEIEQINRFGCTKDTIHYLNNNCWWKKSPSHVEHYSMGISLSHHIIFLTPYKAVTKTHLYFLYIISLSWGCPK